MWCHPCNTRRPCTAPIDLRASNSVRSAIYVSQAILAELPKICEPQTLPDRLYACWHSKPLRWARTKISLKYLRPGIPDKGGVQDDRGSRREYFGTILESRTIGFIMRNLQRKGMPIRLYGGGSHGFLSLSGLLYLPDGRLHGPWHSVFDPDGNRAAHSPSLGGPTLQGGIPTQPLGPTV